MGTKVSYHEPTLSCLDDLKSSDQSLSNFISECLSRNKDFKSDLLKLRLVPLGYYDKNVKYRVAAEDIFDIEARYKVSIQGHFRTKGYFKDYVTSPRIELLTRTPIQYFPITKDMATQQLSAYLINLFTKRIIKIKPTKIPITKKANCKETLALVNCKDKLCIVLDLSYPNAQEVQNQLAEIVKVNYNCFRKRSKQFPLARKRIEDWVECLKIYDLVHRENIELKDVYDKLFPTGREKRTAKLVNAEKSKIYKRYNTAKNLICGGYKKYISKN